jgi:hypothetical protein
MKIDIDWEHQGYEGVLESTIKKYNAMIHTQSAVHCMVELVRQNKIDTGKVLSIEVADPKTSLHEELMTNLFPRSANRSYGRSMDRFASCKGIAEALSHLHERPRRNKKRNPRK